MYILDISGINLLILINYNKNVNITLSIFRPLKSHSGSLDDLKTLGVNS